MEQQLYEKASPLSVMSYEAGFSVTVGCDCQCCLVFLSMQNVHFTARIGKMISLGCSQEERDLLGISGRPPSKGPLRRLRTLLNLPVYKSEPNHSGLRALVINF